MGLFPAQIAIGSNSTVLGPGPSRGFLVGGVAGVVTSSLLLLFLEGWVGASQVILLAGKGAGGAKFFWQAGQPASPELFF
jgi:hypothetical protein